MAVEFFRKHIDYDLQLEESALGIMILEKGCFGSAYGLLESDCFYDSNHRTVYNEVEALWKSGAEIDCVSVAHHLYQKGILEIGGENTAYYLSKITLRVIRSDSLVQWCLYLRELYAKRIMMTATSGGLKDGDIFHQAGNISSMINKALEIRSTDDWQTGKSVAKALMQQMDNVHKEGKVGITTSITTLDDINGGFKPGQMIVIGARPGVGKSAFFGRIAVRAASQKKRIGVISLEMVSTDIFARLVAAETDIPFKSIERNEFIEESQRNFVYQGINTVSQLPIFFSDTAQVNIHDIRAKADKLHRRYGLDMLIIDYLQLVESSGDNKNKNRENEVSSISRGIKLIAMNMKIPVIALAQLNRQVEGRDGAKRYPRLSDLRESGSLEQDADIVMFLHRDFVSGVTDIDGQSTENDADLIVAKWRNGSPTNIKLHFQGDTMKFSELHEIHSKQNYFNNPSASFRSSTYKDFTEQDKMTPF